MRSFRTLLIDEDGNTVIEATIVVTMCIVILAVMLIFGFIFYQENLLQSVADKAANDIARTYTYKGKDPVTGYISINGLNDQSLLESAYYFTDDISGMKSRKITDGEGLTKKYLNNNRIINAHSETITNIKIENSKNVLFQKEITVTIEEEYSIPFIKLLGIENGIITRKYSGSALCFDIVGARSFHNLIYVISYNLKDNNAIKDVKYVVNIIENFYSAGTNVEKLVKKLFGWGD